MIINLTYLGFTAFLVFLIPILRKIYFHESNKKFEINERKNRYGFFDFLRGLAILAVIFIHIGDNFYTENTGNILFIKTINDIARFAVPFFFISSGILLLKRNSLKEFYQKKITRTFLPYFFLTVFIGLYFKSNLFKIAYVFIAGAASDPYYFMAVLLQFYLIYPILEKYSKRKYFLHITFLITVASALINFTWSFYGIPLFLRYLFLFAYGISQKNKFLAQKYIMSAEEKYFWFLVVIYYLVTSVYFQLYFYNSRIFYAIALFNVLFLFKNRLKELFIYNSLVFLGKNSLWIYLIHYFIIQALYFNFIKELNVNFYLEYFYFVLIGVPLSIFFSFLFKYIYNLLLKMVLPKPVK